jgi:hypothetical protein
MPAPMSPSRLAPGEARVRVASLALLLVNAWVAGQIGLHDRLEFFGCEMGDIVGLPLAVLGIGLGIKLCGWPRSFAFGHSLLFLYSFGLFATLIPYFTVHGYARYQQLLSLWRHWM